MQWTIRRRSWASATNTKSTRSVAVGTIKKSIDTRSFTCWSRNVVHVGEGGRSRRGWYFSTVDLATAIPSFRSSATIRGEPQVGLACHIRLMRFRNSRDIRGRPGWLNARQYSRNRLFCQMVTVRGWTKNNAFRQPDHNFATTDQSSRSAGAMRGRRPFDWYRES